MRLLGKILVKSIDIMQAFTINMGGLLLVFIVGLMTTAVLFRYVVQNPVYLAEGFLQLMMGWMVFLLMASVSRRDEHIRIGFFVNKVLGPRAKPFIFALENISSLVLCIYFGFWGIRWVQMALRLGMVHPYNAEGDTYAVWIRWIIVPIGVWLTAVIYIERIFIQARSVYRQRKAKREEDMGVGIASQFEEGM